MSRSQRRKIRRIAAEYVSELLLSQDLPDWVDNRADLKAEDYPEFVAQVHLFGKQLIGRFWRNT